ncbi:MAG TPA: GumC family protein, partial [Methylocystis sp.]|nr:GumC family protein [Methylocystis sp.]
MSVSTNDAGGEIDLAQIWRAVSAKRWWVIVPTLSAFVCAFLYVNVAKPRYTAEARLLLETQESFLPHADKTAHGPETAPDAEAVQSQLELLKSRDLARRAIRTLGLQGNEEFDPLAKGVGVVTRLLVMLGLARDPLQVSPEDRMLDVFADRLNVLSPLKTRVLGIEFTTRDPDLSARGANAVAESYLEFQQEAKRSSARDAAKTLSAIVAEMQRRVTEAETRVEEFRARSGLLLGANNTNINAQHLSDLNTQLSLARSAQADAQAKARLLKDMLRQSRIGDIPDVANNEVMRKLQEQRVTLRAQLALESRTLLPGHPRIKELEAQLADLDRQTRAAAERVARTLENEARIAGGRVENLTAALDEQKQIVGSSEANEAKLRELESQARVLKEQFENDEAKYQEASARENAQATPADARIIQRALS